MGGDTGRQRGTESRRRGEGESRGVPGGRSHTDSKGGGSPGSGGVKGGGSPGSGGGGETRGVQWGGSRGGTESRVAGGS